MDKNIIKSKSIMLINGTQTIFETETIIDEMNNGTGNQSMRVASYKDLVDYIFGERGELIKC